LVIVGRGSLTRQVARVFAYEPLDITLIVCLKKRFHVSSSCANHTILV
jgi:hypothetical protein